MISREDVREIIRQNVAEATAAGLDDTAGLVLALLQPEVDKYERRLAQELANLSATAERCRVLEERARKAESEEHISPGTGMYLVLARAVINRILSAEAKCDPPLDILLRLESIIRERDALQADLATAQAALGAMQEALERIADKSSRDSVLEPTDFFAPSLIAKLAGVNRMATDALALTPATVGDAVGRLVRAAGDYTDYPSNRGMTELIDALNDPALAAWRK